MTHRHRSTGMMSFRQWRAHRDTERAEAKLCAEMLTFPSAPPAGVTTILRRAPEPARLPAMALAAAATWLMIFGGTLFQAAVQIGKRAA